MKTMKTHIPDTIWGLILGGELLGAAGSPVIPKKING